MKTLTEFKEEYANRQGYQSWQNLKDQVHTVAFEKHLDTVVTEYEDYKSDQVQQHTEDMTMAQALKIITQQLRKTENTTNKLDLCSLKTLSIHDAVPVVQEQFLNWLPKKPSEMTLAEITILLKWNQQFQASLLAELEEHLSCRDII